MEIRCHTNQWLRYVGQAGAGAGLAISLSSEHEAIDQLVAI